jgi:predicted nucleic acid-binding Zn ribbon protein
MEIKKVCPECGDAINGRIDKIFCSDQCRNEYNNRKNQDASSFIRRVNYALRKNRRILEELNPDGKKKVSKAKLLNRGFDFRFLTNIYRTKAGNTYYFCYEHGYLPINEKFFKLLRKDEYKQKPCAIEPAERNN